MKLAILSDIHDNVWKLAAALEAVAATDAMICCGDLCSPFVAHQIGRGYSQPVHIVFGNNDGDPYRIATVAAKYANLNVHGEFFADEFDGKRIAVNHFDYIARPIAASGQFDVVCYGHNHLYRVENTGKTLAVNPGALMGAAFAADGTRRDVACTFAVYDTNSGDVDGFEVTRQLTVVQYRA